MLKYKFKNMSDARTLMRTFLLIFLREVSRKDIISANGVLKFLICDNLLFHFA